MSLAVAFEFEYVFGECDSGTRTHCRAASAFITVLYLSGGKQFFTKRLLLSSDALVNAQVASILSALVSGWIVPGN